MSLVVLKFGGSSLKNKKARRAAVNRIEESLQKGNKPIVIVSAIGRKGSAYATDTLLELAENTFKDLDGREKDLIMSCGEIISSVIMVQHLKKKAIKAKALTGAQAGILTDENYCNSDVININPENVLRLINKNIVPVIAGFQGISKNGEITTLGRGGSDTTASIIAAGLSAKKIEIYTDVEGLLTGDPSIIEKANFLAKTNYTEACELAYQGAEVIHPAAAEIAMKNKIPIEVRSTFNNKEGTIIDKIGDKKKLTPITGLASREDIFYTKVKAHQGINYDNGLQIFELLADAGISVDFINIRESVISFVINNDKRNLTEKIMSTNGFDFEIHPEYVKISIVGGGMTGQPGIMARIVNTLHEVGVKIYQTTDSHTVISCLIKEEDKIKALNALHDAFNLNTIGG
ncbi:MAG: aspartate kinase [Halanaerobiales bacterium]